MIRSLVFAAVALGLASGAVAQKRILPTKPLPVPAWSIQCTSTGDALGGLEVAGRGKSVVIRHTTMEPKTITYPATIVASAAQKAGGLVVVGKMSQSIEFGGAVNPAVLLVLEPKPATGKRTGLYAYGGSVVYLTCQN